MEERNLSDFDRINNHCYFCRKPTDLLNDEIVCFGYLSFIHGPSSYFKDWIDYASICYGCFSTGKDYIPIPFGSHRLTFEEYKKFVYLSKLL